eukprot:768060-Hanusia_phi.AAC.1
MEAMQQLTMSTGGRPKLEDGEVEVRDGDGNMRREGKRREEERRGEERREREREREGRNKPLRHNRKRKQKKKQSAASCMK